MIVEAKSSRFAPWLATLAVFAGLVLIFQGWRGDFTGGLGGPEYDHVVNLEEALRLTSGEGLPRKGGISTLGTYIPPGTSWLLVPGILTGDPNLFQLAGSSLAYVLACLGVYFVARQCGGNRAAMAATILYAVSGTALVLGSSLWPRAQPFAGVWMVFFTILWCHRRQAWWLAAALATYAIGIYIYLEMLPAILIPAIGWLLYRPPLRIAPLAVSLIVGVAVWSPYLAFQTERGFVDLQSQLFLQGLPNDPEQELAAQGNFKLERWNFATQQPEPFALNPTETAASSAGNQLKRIFFRIWTIALNLSNNFLLRGPGGAVMLALFCAAALAWLVQRTLADRWLAESQWLRWVGCGLLVISSIANPWIAGRIMGRPLDGSEAIKVLLLEGVLAALGASLILPRLTSRGLRSLADCWNWQPAKSANVQAFLIVLLPTLAIWLGLSIVGKTSRYLMWLWPLQVIVAVQAIYAIAGQWRQRRWIGCGIFALALAGLAANSFTMSRLREWRAQGYAGETSPAAQAADFLAEKFTSNMDSKAVKLGYHLFFNGWEAAWHRFDEHYRIGAPIDSYLRLKHGLANRLQPQEGFSSDDEYRLIETQGRTGKAIRFQFADREFFDPVATFGTLEVWRRKASDKATSDKATSDKATSGDKLQREGK